MSIVRPSTPILPAALVRRCPIVLGLIGLVGLSALALPRNALAQGAWSVAGQMPVERGQTAAAPAHGRVYLITGSAPGSAATGMLQVFDPGTGTWRDLTPMPDIASHAGAATIDGRIYVVGGFVDNVHVGAMDRVFAYDVAEDAWQSLPPLNVPRGSPGVVVLDGRIHAIGGRDDEGLVEAHEVYDPVAGRWSAAAPLPLARDHLGIAAGEGRIHVFGGRTGGSSDNTGRHDIYDPATDSWSEGDPMPTPRSGGVAFRLGNLLVYAGGECRPGESPPTYDEVEGYDLEVDGWIPLTPLPDGLHAGAAAVVERSAYVMGGRHGCGGGQPTLDVLEFHVP